MSSRDFRQIYFYEFKLGRTAAQTARNINEVWGQGSVNECTVQRWFQKFRAGNTSFEDEPHGSRLPTLDIDQLKASVEADPHKTTGDIAKELNVHHTTIVRHLKQNGKTKKYATVSFLLHLTHNQHLDNFLREKRFRNQDDAETAFNEFIASRNPDFYDIGIKKLVSRWQKCVDCNGDYFD
uniref:HTH_48 domain-containing protein n=1 Tax=Haemonchus contortus TaxID=6289 RepID=A0A7I5E7F6_HAECO